MECPGDHREERGGLMQVLKVTPSGTELIRIDRELRSLQKVVGGHIDIVTLVPGHLVMIVDDEGLLKGYPLNPGASAIAERCIVGDVIIAGVKDEDISDIPSGIITAMMSITNLAIAGYAMMGGI